MTEFIDYLSPQTVSGIVTRRTKATEAIRGGKVFESLILGVQTGASLIVNCVEVGLRGRENNDCCAQGFAVAVASLNPAVPLLFGTGFSVAAAGQRIRRYFKTSYFRSFW